MFGFSFVFWVVAIIICFTIKAALCLTSLVLLFWSSSGNNMETLIRWTQTLCFWSEKVSPLFSTSTVNVCSLLQETLIGVWAQADERTSEQESEWKRVREREKRKDRRGNRSKQGTSPPDTHWCWDRPNLPPWPEHTLLPDWGAPRSPRRRGTTGSQRSGVREMALFLFCLLPEMTKKTTTVWTREQTTKRRLNTWPMARQTDRKAGWTHHLPPREERLIFRSGHKFTQDKRRDLDIFVFGTLRI